MTAGTQILEATSAKAPPPGRSTETGSGRSKALGSLKVLVVEDESIIAWALQSLIEDLGHEVVDVAASGERAIEAATRHRPDLILMDIHLGAGADGIETAERIRMGGTVALIFVSAYGDEGTKARIRDCVPGATLLTKPVSAKAVRHAIEVAFGTRH